ncbi:3-carboxy-cis,cis-muconate cycloisomerase [Xanthomonas oryzae]|uniref:3-carboxy-cis,cis-muconate cycloisomerase n=1 Tax=Xanthomonas oryzae pv. oryzae TaxID=64187 RepID=A0AAJ5MF82_XANOO|nr:3-carboxy-cis,cis-muconate cycloisomerase [Xanthomonas oryzae]OLI99603.1 3-carboxy-cis,cis-muconate cycloisomerase [Xanthomonas oryzae pv. oryzae]OLK24001.1 3-carboxy-cis,cis-muconate cycloisomerase [Xanthomonas oryzae pv. oryzae]OLK43585.1 3-carboxy-cis,cis-muconate cycloisomerase [Xanthomonas oryzae pv. oryzae]QIE21315.1 3-carboxy-cis,cis-muconate cycloisomerase [Xanthomonas oryzae pv. oryzae]RBJ68221.1 3-carboxy-cis,cis-muconate cycloisomerase [Xanthomonas oryzae pv. oryzae]
MSATSSLLGSLFGEPACDALFDDAARVQAMLQFESALARAQAQCGVIPTEAAQAIAAACDVRHHDLAALAQATALAGNPAIPLVKALTAQVAAHDSAAARWVHWGATSQDVLDTGTVLQLRAALDLLLPRLHALCAGLATLAERERDTGLPGRTLLQQAVPVTFGLKVAAWLDALQRAHQRLQAMQHDALVLHFGGAAGTLASLQERGLEVAQALASTLELPLPALPWHTARDRIVEVGCAFGLLAGTLGKIGGDVVLLMQSEVGEAFEPAAAGKGGLSAMPHKRNPVSSVAAVAAATRVPGLVATLFSAMAQPHERAAGQWHAEWDTLPQIVCLTAGSLAQMQQCLSGLELDRARMRIHLDSHGRLLYAEAAVFALAPQLGKPQAHALVQQAALRAQAQQRHLREVLGEDAQVSAVLTHAQLQAVFDSDSWRGMSSVWIDRVLAGSPSC